MSMRDRLPMKAAVIVEWNHFCSAPIFQFGKPLEETRIALKVATGYEYDNRHNRVYFSRHEFSFNVTMETASSGSPRYREITKLAGAHAGPNGSNVYTLVFWNFEGVEHLFESMFTCEPDDHIPSDVTKAARACLEQYSRGVRSCSDCGAETEAGASRRYFAGIYCEPCWAGSQGKHAGRGGWKAMEAAETYE